ncbi:cobyric acid synthase [Paenibacillus piri]|uniref:Cobyric acid synthase n=1 Tax=Paenibacillus piri TaxID=2547395 RepID=A0A4R5KZ50_9BACL|nr:cobyric acid synthase [Paenibacillus piri]TDG00438.1 cobyric acid synthase [Paenibacillus piri]
MLERYGHGGDLWTAAKTFGLSKDAFLDFSSNMNPLGPPNAAQIILRDRWRDIAAYPDPAVRELRAKLAAKYEIPAESILVGNGAAELIDLSVRLLQPGVTALARPSFSEYEEAVHKTDGAIYEIPLFAAHGFMLEETAAERALARSDLLFLGSPNNPTGRLLPPSVLERLAAADKPVIVDEAFIDFCPDEARLSMIRTAADSRHLTVIRSMTKFYSIPGLRLGFMVAHPDRIRLMRQQQVQWSVNTMAQLIGAAVLDDREFERRTHAWLAEERPWLIGKLTELGLLVTPSDTNYLLFSLKPLGITVQELQAEMGRRGVLIRDASRFPGLDSSYVRTAIRLREHNERLIRELGAAIGALTGSGKLAGRSTGGDAAAAQGSRMETGHMEPERPVPQGAAPALPFGSSRPREPVSPASQGATLMVQGTSSDAGKSLLATALCRILWQDGLRVAPFKSQNMSLNSYVTADGKEIGRAQGMQADACRVAATTDMNPILLKPKKDMVSQVVVHGKPLRDFDARTYREKYLPEAEAIVRDALARLRETYQVVVLEGAGSPAEVNLKDSDIVNMRLAGWADAPVVLVADIDRGGVFASLLGTMEIFTPEEQARVKGFIINKFRGDVSLLKPGLDWLEQRTGKPVLGVIPYLPDLELEDEDSASLDRKLAAGAIERGSVGRGTLLATDAEEAGSAGRLDLAVIRLPRLSNFTDIDPLLYESDVRLRYVGTAEELGQPDAVIIPGSKNTVDDLLFLRSTGLDQALAGHARRGGWIAGICAGYQMMGERLLDPELLESDRPETAGLGLFPAETVFKPDKQTVRAVGEARLFDGGGSDDAVPAYRISGYEIHMGRTRFLRPVKHPFYIAEEGGCQEAHPDGVVSDNGKLWGTYVHGILHNDDFRRAWLNAIRLGKGWEPLKAELRFQERREAAFDRLAAHVRNHLDMDRLYEMIDYSRQAKQSDKQIPSQEAIRCEYIREQAMPGRPE